MKISVSSVYGSSNLGWFAFNGDTSYTNGWAGSSTTAWLILELPYQIKISSILFYTRIGSQAGAMKSVRLYAGISSSGTLLAQDSYPNDTVGTHKLSIPYSSRKWSSNYYFYFPDYYGSYTPFIRHTEITAVYRPGTANLSDMYIADHESQYFIKY